MVALANVSFEYEQAAQAEFGAATEPVAKAEPEAEAMNLLQVDLLRHDRGS